MPATSIPEPERQHRLLDLRQLTAHQAADQFFFIQHYNKPEIDAAAFRLKLTGLFKKPAELSLDDIKSMKPVEIVCGYECSGNSPRAMQGLSSNGRFTGVRLRDVLKRAGVDDRAREVVFSAPNRGPEEVVFRQKRSRFSSISAAHHDGERDEPEPILAYRSRAAAHRDHVVPARVVMPGWYGVSNVKGWPRGTCRRALLGNSGALVPHAARRRPARAKTRCADQFVETGGHAPHVKS